MNRGKKFIAVLLSALCILTVFASGCIPGVGVDEGDSAVQKRIRECKKSFLTSPTDYYMKYSSYSDERDEYGWFLSSCEVVVEDTSDFRRYAEINYEQGYAVYCNGNNVRRYDVATGAETEEQTDFDELYYIKYMRKLLITIRDEVLGIIPKNERYSNLRFWPFYYSAYILDFCYDVELPIGDDVYRFLSLEINTALGKDMLCSLDASTHKIDGNYDDEGTYLYISPHHNADIDRCLERYLRFIDEQK